MRAKLLLRVAAILIFLHLLGHAGGHAGWDKPEDPRMQEVVTAMKGYSAEFMGATKSMGDYFNGYSLILFGLYGMSIIILWFASGSITENRTLVVKILWPIAIAYLYFGVVEYIAFFPLAAGMSFFAGVLVMLAIVAGKA